MTNVDAPRGERDRDDLDVVADFYFAQIPEWVLYHDTLTDRSVRIYGFLHRRAGRSGIAKPGRKLLAQLARCSVSSVDRSIDELEAAGAICRRRTRHFDGDFDRTQYVVHMAPCGGCVEDAGEQLPFVVSSRVTTGGVTRDATGSRTRDEGVASPVTQQRESPYNESPTTPDDDGVVVTRDDTPDPDTLRRNGIWDALVARLYPSGELTPSTRKRLGRVQRELHLVGATAADVDARVDAWPNLWPGGNLTLTLEALLKWWSELGVVVTSATAGDAAASCPSCHGRGIVVVLEDGSNVPVDADEAWRSETTRICPDPIHRRGGPKR